MAKDTILVVDDDSNLLEVIRMRLEAAKYEVVTALQEKEALDLVSTKPFDLAIIDLQLESMDGISLMKDVHGINPDMPVIILTAHGSIESAVEAMQSGSFSYVTKPFDPRELLFQIEKALEAKRLTSEVKRLKDLLGEIESFSDIVVKSRKMKDILGQVSKFAVTDSTVFISGESGTGKELIAQAVHMSSNRKEEPFIAINCSAIPDNLLESELFGVVANYPGLHNKEALTGKIELADRGTLFLDEIADMPVALQSKMLRVLQEKQLSPLGSVKPVNVDVRIVVATNKDLWQEVKEGNFREDLYYRVHVIPIKLPPLRERKEDIPPLVEHFVGKFRGKMNKKVKGLSSKAMRKLMLHNWPGNVRELGNTVEFAMAMTQDNVISDDLIILQAGVQGAEVVKTFKEAKSDFEREYLVNILMITHGNVSKASEMAGKYRADFYQLLKKYDIKPDEYKNR